MAKRNFLHRIACPFELAMEVVSGKWKGMIIFILNTQAKRYTELKSQLNGISNRMLTLALRELEADGLVIKRIQHGSFSKNEYILSDIGQALLPVFMAMREWGLSYQDYLGKAKKHVNLYSG